MTKYQWTHPLSFQDIAEISKQRLITAELCEDMRAAADWQLMQVIAFIEREVQWIGSNVYEIGQGDREFTQNLRQAMRPQEDS